MAFLARQTFTGVAAQQAYVLTITPILSDEHLTATIDGAAAAFTFDLATSTITFEDPIAGGETITVQRITPVTEAGRLVVFQDLGYLRQSDLDTAQLQLLANVQEALDGFAEVLRVGTGGSGQWDGMNLRLENLDDGVADQDAATVSQLNALVIAAGNLPIVNMGNNDWGLAVVAGAWAARTPSQMRVHLGLGSAAVEDAGTGANELVQLNGTAQYPALDGQLIDLTSHPLTAAIALKAETVRGQTIRSTSFAMPAVAGTWYESNTSRIDPGTLTNPIDNDSDITVNGGSKFVTLSAGSWEIGVVVRARNSDVAGPGNFRQFGIRVTDDVDGPTQVTYFNALDTYDLESQEPDNGQAQLQFNFYVKLSTSKNIVLRVSQHDGLSAQLQIDYVALTFHKITDSFS